MMMPTVVASRALMITGSHCATNATLSAPVCVVWRSASTASRNSAAFAVSRSAPSRSRRWLEAMACTRLCAASSALLHLVRFRSRHLQTEQRRHRRQRIADAVVGVLQQRLDPLAFALGVSTRFLGLRGAFADQRLELLVLHLQQPAGLRQRRDLRLRAGEERVGQCRRTGERRKDRADQPLPVALDAAVALDQPRVFLGDEAADRLRAAAPSALGRHRNGAAPAPRRAVRSARAGCSRPSPRACDRSRRAGR